MRKKPLNNSRRNNKILSFLKPKPRKWAIGGASLIALAVFFNFVAAQLYDDAYVVRTVHVFPSQIEAIGWQNAETITFQNLDEYALLQEFNTINSATMNTSFAARLQIERTNEQRNNEEAQDVNPEVEPNPPAPTEELSEESIPEEVPTEVATETPAVSETEEEPVNPEAQNNPSPTTEQPAFDFVVPNEVPASTQAETQTTTTPAQPEPEPVTEEESEVSATTTVLRKVESVFALAMNTVTSVFGSSTEDTTSDEEPEPAPEPEPTEEVSDPEQSSEPQSSSTPQTVEEPEVEAVSAETEPSATSTDEFTDPVQNQATSTAETSSDVPETPTTTPGSEIDEESVDVTPPVSQPEPEPCEEDCVPYVITLGDFGFPLEPNVELTGAQLRMSMASQKKSTRDRIPSLDIRYSLDGGGTWTSGGVIIIDDEVSNSINGGYYLFALPDVTDQDTLNSLKVQLVYENDPEIVTGLFIESVWLELFTLEPSEDVGLPDAFDLSQIDDNYESNPLSGDTLLLPNGEEIDIEFTDENEGETLIIKSDRKDYVGLTKTTTYFSVTNTGSKADDFTLQTYFPRGSGEVVSLKEYERNKPVEVVIPEYRPFVFHCEAGWEYIGTATPDSIEDLSRQFSGVEVEEVSDENETETSSSTEPVFDLQVPSLEESASNTPEVFELPGTSSTDTTVSFLLPDIRQLLQAATTTVNNASSSASSTDSTIDEEEKAEYLCRNTNVVRACDEVDGDNTACRVSSTKVAEHVVTQYVPGWIERQKNEGEMPEPGFIERALQFIGFGPDKKPVPEGFEVRTHSQDTYSILPGETKYFEMQISFPPFSSGEYWVEAIGDREYGLLDPFWSSQWRYRMPITVDNPTGQEQTEQQVFLELGSALTDFWTNVKSDGGDIRFIQENSSGQVWYNANWQERIPITIQASEINDDITNLPVYVDLADLGTDFFSGVNNDGSDIRITASDGQTEFAYDLVDIDTGAETGQLHFLASSTISSTTDTTFYVYYGNSAATAYGASDPFGSQAVWSNDYIAVYHLEEDASGRGNAGLYQDSTANGYDADDELNSTGQTGQLGAGQEVDAQGDANEYMLLPSAVVNGETELVFSYWMNSTEAANQALINGGAGNEYLLFLTGGGTGLQLFPGSTVSLGTDLSNGTWRHVTVTRDTVNNQWRVFVDGVQVGTSSVSLGTLSIPASCLTVGLEQDGSCLSSGDTSQHLNAFIDEMRFKSTIPSDAYIAATYENQASTTNFYSVGTSEVQELPTFTELDHWVQHFDNTNDEADIWVQIPTIPSSATSTIYIYYGNSSAAATSDEFETFTYSTTTDLYYVVNDSQSNPIVVYSLIDGNEVSIDGGAAIPLDQGETTSFATYSSTSVISALGPITARTSDDASEPPVPISFASTTHIVTTNRNNEDFYVYSPFNSADVEVYEGANGTPTATSTVVAGAADTYNVNLGGSDAGIVESDEPILLYHNNDTDSYVAYPPTTRDLFGVYSNSYRYSAIAGSASVEIYCSGGSNGTTTGMTRGGFESNDFCANGGQGTGNAVRLTGATEPIGATQEADGDGNESSRFLPEPEFGTFYIFPQAAEYVTVVCSPRFGSVDIEIQDTVGATASSSTCTPSGEYPGRYTFTPASDYPQGYRAVSTNDVPFYMYYEDGGTGDETNTWSAVQGKKFQALDTYTYAFGAEEENEDAQYEQLNFRWYENNDAVTPTTPWDLGEDGTADEGDAIDGQGAVNPGDELRLRMNLLANNGTGSVDSTSFILQYVEAQTCSAVTESSWLDLGDIGSTTAAFAGFGTPVADGSTLPSTLLSDSDVAATFEEENVSRTIPNEVANGEAVEFDWSITPVVGTVEANAEYCFRMIRSTRESLATYTLYPQLLTAGPPEIPETIERFDNEHASSVRPTLEFSAVDQGGDELDYQVQVSTDNTFGTTNLDRRSDVNTLEFESVLNGSDKSPFDNGSTIRFTPPSDLTSSTTYWWRVRAIDPNGSNTFGDWSAAKSFTIDESVTVSEWFQTTDEQFETNTLTSATTSGSDSIEADIGGSSLLGEYGSLDVTVGATTTVNFNNTFTDPVVVTSVRYSRSIANGDQPISRVFNKTGTSFDVLAHTFDFTSVGTATVDWIVMEAGEALMDDGADGLRVFATSTSVSAIAGANIPTDPGGVDIVFPTTFTGAPMVLAAVTTSNDPQWVAATVYDGNDIGNPPTASQVSLYLNDSLASNGHGSAEDIDIIAFQTGSGDNDSVAFATQITANDVSDTPIAKTYGNTYSSTPGVIVVQQLTMNGAQGGYSMVDIDTPPTNTQVTVAAEEGGNAGARTHANETLGIVSFESGSGDILRAGNAEIVSTAIDFDDADVGNAWGQVSWNDTGDITYTVQYQTGSGFQDIPDEDLPNNSTGFTSSPINILSLDTTTYNEIRLVARMGGVNPEIYDWTVTWGQRVDTPTLGDPFDNQKLADTTPTFDFVSSDPQGDALDYEISISTDPTFASASTTINSSASSSDFANLDGGSANPYTSGDRVAYTLPAGLALSDGTTYWWRVRAKDPGGSDAWSPWSVADNFTISSTTIVSSWFQTTQAQFTEGELDGVIASSTDSVEISTEIGEYGTTSLTGNGWVTVNTQLTYNNMVVIARPSYVYDTGTDNHRVLQVRNKTANSFELKAENATLSLAGSTNVDYVVMEAGDWTIVDGGSGVRVIAGTETDVSEVEGSNTTYVGGRSVSFSPAFGSAPTAFTMVSTANGSDWVTSNVDDGTAGGNVGTGGMFVSLHVSLDTTVTRTPEDIDYIVMEVATGTNNSTPFDSFNSADSVGGTPVTVNFNQSFATAPGIILSQVNGIDGGDGAVSIEDETTTKSSASADFTSVEIPVNGAHTAEVISVLAIEDETGTIARESASVGGLIGTIASEEVLFSDGVGPKFDRALFSATTPGNSTTSLQIQYQTATGSWALLPDTEVPGNSSGNASGVVDLTGIDIVTYPVIRLLATLECDSTNCPTLDDWTVEWSEGVLMTGTLQEYDRITNVANATVTVSVNGGAPVRTGTVTAGVWSITNVTAFAGDIVTVFVSDVPDDEEAVAVFQYDGLGDMTDVILYEQHLTLSSNETATVTIAELGLSDNGLIGDEDVFFDVSVGGDLSVCALTGCDNANLFISGSSTFVLSTTTGQTISAHDIINEGSLVLSNNDVEVSGSWYNLGSLSVGTSRVTMTATTGVEALSDADGTLDFYNLTFGQSTGTATWQSNNPYDVNGSLAVDYGTFDRSSSTVNVARQLSTGANGYWNGISTTTLDGSGTFSWSDSNPVSQNVGILIVDGSARTVTVGSTVEAQSITIGANDTLNAGGSNDIRINGNFVNNNVFVPSTSRVVVVGSGTVANITMGGSNLNTLRASSTGGSVSFTQTTVTLTDNLEVATGTVNLPTTLLQIGGSLLNSGGNIAHNNAEVRFIGSGSESIQLLGTPFLNSLYDVSFTGSGDWTFLDVSATVTNEWNQSDGWVTFPTGDLTVGRDFTTSGGGSFDANNGRVIFLILGNDSVTTNGSSFHDMLVRESSGGSFVWYNDSWTHRIPVTIRASEVDDDLTNFPVYVDLSDFPSAFFTNLTADGGDIRVTEDDGATEVPREVVNASTTAETGELYFRASSLSSTTDTTFYLYYGNATATDYAVGDTNGAENVWSNGYVLVAHMNDETTSTIVNSVDGSLDGTKDAANSPLESALGKIYEAQDNDGSAHIGFGNVGSGATNITISAWINPDNLTGAGDTNTYGYSIFSAHSSGQYTWLTVGGTGGGGSTDEVRFCAFSNSATCNVASGSNIGTGEWNYVSASAIDGGAANVRVNGSNVLSFVSDGGGTWNSGSTIGDLRPDRDIEFEGLIDEVQISNVVRSNAWQDATYRNQGTTTDFYAVGSPQQENVRTLASASVEADGDVYIESGTLVLPTGIFDVGGSFDNDDEFDANGGTVRFNATTTGHTVAAGVSDFYNLTFNGVGGGWTITEDATSTNVISYINADNVTVDAGVVLDAAGTFSNAVANGSTTWLGTLRLSGSDHTINLKSHEGDDYNVLSIADGVDIKMWNSSASAYDLDGTASLYSQDHDANDGDLYIFGDYTRSAGTEYWNSDTDFDGADLVASSSERQVDVRIAAGGSVTISTSTLDITGSSTASTTVDAQSGSYALTLANATFTAQYFTMTGGDANGLNFTASTSVSSFSDASFTIPTGFSAITVDGTTIDTNPGAQYFRTNFISGSGNVNVTLSGSPTSFWWFREGAGDRYGEAFDNADGDPGSIRWDDSSFTINVSGTVYADDGSSTLGGPTCDGSTQNIRIVVDGGTYASSTSCNGLDGSFAFSGVAFIGDPNIVVYLDTNGGENGAVITKTPTADITDLNIYADRVMTRHEDVSPLTIADMISYDEDDDSDLRFVAATGTPNTLIVRPDTELIVASSTTFVPGGNIILQSGGSGSIFDGSLHIDDGASFVATGNETHLIGGSFFNDASSTFTAASSTLTFTATTSGKGITNANAGTLDFNILNFTGVGGGWNLTADIQVAADMTISTGTVTGTGDITMLAGTLGGDGLLSLGGGTTTILTSTTLGGVQGWTFYDLVLGDGATTSTTTRTDTATTTISGQLVIESAHFLDTGSSLWNLAGAGDVFVENGTLLQDTSTFTYSGGTGATVLPTTYYNLRFDPSAGTPIYSAGAIGLLVENDLTLAGSVSNTFDLDSADPLLAVQGDVYVGSNSTLSLSSATDALFSGNYDNDGSLNANGGTVEFNGTSPYTIAAGTGEFADVLLSGTGAVNITESATSTGLFTIAPASDFTLDPGVRLAVGGQMAIQSSSTTWTNSVLHLYGGGDYTLLAKTLSDTFGELSIGANTEIRLWNSSAATTTVDATGSLYSQDHADVDGDLYIFGSYVEETRDDYWSYATDFDGTDLTASSAERRADVYFASGASATWTGGSLSVVGTSTASTTVQNQGAGTYSLVHGGSSDVTWLYATVRDIDSNGLVFTGTPNLIGFDDVDLLVEINSASAMTVGGTAITASPARTLERVLFNDDIGVTGAVNVTATGTTLSGWRFTSHYGDIDGEAFDSDPTGDPGYIIWDDSAAIISISGNVYEADGVSVSSVCDDATTNIVLSIAGSIAQNASSSCSSADGSYLISGVSFGSLDELMLYIDGEADSGVTVSKDPISSISDMDIYENHVIVRHENTNPLTIADMTVWDSSDDADIPYTAVTGSPDTLTLPSDTKLLVWASKDFEPQGDMTLTGGGAGAAYDGSFEVLANASFIAAAGENHDIGGSFEFAANADFVAGGSEITFTTDDAGRLITVNGDAFYALTFNGAGDWSVTDTGLLVTDDLTITSGTLALPSGTTTIGASFVNSDTFVASSGLLSFAATTGSETVTFGSSDAHAVQFIGGASWTISDTNATATNAFTVATGTVTMPSGILAVGSDFIVLDTLTHNSGTLALTATTGTTTLTLSGNDLGTLTIVGGATTTMTDASAALQGDLNVNAGALYVATNTLSIAGSLDATGGIMETASGTILFNSADTGEFIDPGANDFYNVSIANVNGGWTLLSATATNNFNLNSASNFTLGSGETLVVGGVFINTVGGSNTTWSGSTLVLDGANEYSVNSSANTGDQYENLIITSNSDIRIWNSAATTTTVATSSSLYSQDHSAVNGSLYIYGDFEISTSTEYWSYSRDFDGTVLSGAAQRQVTVSHASSATTTLVAGGSLQVIGAAGATTTIQNQGVGAYDFQVTGGNLSMQYYALRNLTPTGMDVSGTPSISSLNNGDWELTVEGGTLLNLNRTALDANPSFLILDNRFALGGGIFSGTNVNLSATSTNSWTFRYDYGDLSGESFDVDGITSCGSIRWDDSSCLLTEQTEYRWRNNDGGIDAPDDEWYDTNWSKRKRVRFANNDNTAYTNQPFLITVTYDSDMQADFDDLRFTTADGTTEVDFWVERFTSSSFADVWVEVPSLLAEETVSVFMYYGNATAGSLSSSTAVFDVVDDFEDNDISEYSGQTALFSVDTNFNYGGTYGLELAAGQKGTRLTSGIARFDQTATTGQIIRYKQYVDTVGGASDESCTLFGVQSPVTNNENYAVCLELFGTDRISLVRDAESTDTFGGVVRLASSTVSYTTGWYEVQIDWQTDNTIDVSLFNPSGTLVATTSATDSTYFSGGYGFTSWGQNGGWDSFIARNRVESEPTIFFGAEQVDGGATFTTPQSTATTDFNIGDIARLRIAIENTGLDITNQLFAVEYAGKGAAPTCAAVPSGNYSEVPVNASCGPTDEICMATSSSVTNGAATTDLLEIERNTFSAGSFVEDPSNQTAATNVNQNFYTELEYALYITPNVLEQAYCFRLTDDGTEFDSYINIPELSLQFPPSLGAVTLNDGLDISLVPGTTTPVLATGTVTDLNGVADLNNATTTFYRSGVAGGASCTPDDNNCYVVSSGAGCSFTSCTATTCEVQCQADIFYHADPTDSGSDYDGQEWFAFMEVSDSIDSFDFETSPGVEVNTLRAIDVSGLIDYGALEVNDDTGSFNASTSVFNLGNVEVDLELTGTDLTDGATSQIPADQQKFSTTTFTYSSCGSSCELLSSTTPVALDVELSKPSVSTPPTEDDVYWGIAIPFGVNSTIHSGINVFTPVSP